MVGDDVKSLMSEYQKLWSDQANFRQLWNSIAQYVLPAWDNFIGEFSEGVNRSTRLFDSRAVTNCERFAAIMESMLTPRTQKWHGLSPADESLSEDPECTAWCDTTRDILFTERYRPRANYASQVDECYLQLGAFGNCALMTEEGLNRRGLRYNSIPLNEIVWSLSAEQTVDALYRRFRWTARQCVQRWGIEAVGEKIRLAMEKDPFQEFEILHVVKPNDSHKPGALGPKGKQFSSWYCTYEDNGKTLLEYGGYHTFPYSVGRYRMAPREHYGRSPGSVAFPAIKTLNEMKKTALRAGQKAVDPPLLLSDEGALTPPNLRAGGLSYGALTNQGEPLVVPLESKANFQIGMELMEAEGRSIDDSFLVSVYQILEQNPSMTATEAMIRANEKGILLSPAMGRQQSEFLGPEIERELDLTTRQGLIPPMPAQMLKAGGAKVAYTSPFSQLQKSQEGQTIMTTMQGILQMAGAKPEVLDMYDWDQMTRKFSEASGLPPSLLLSDDQVAQLRQARQQQQAAQAAAGAAPDLSKSALNIAQASQALQPPQGQ